MIAPIPPPNWQPGDPVPRVESISATIRWADGAQVELEIEPTRRNGEHAQITLEGEAVYPGPEDDEVRLAHGVVAAGPFSPKAWRIIFGTDGTWSVRQTMKAPAQCPVSMVVCTDPSCAQPRGCQRIRFTEETDGGS
jgi:hypothetical protein